MFWIGLFIGLILGAIFGIIITSISFLGSKEDDMYIFENTEDYGDSVFEGFEVEIEEEWLRRGVTKNGVWKR